jgi:ABC-2 type transport system permease protein
MNDLFLYLRYAAVSVRAQMSYPGSFILQVIGQFAGTFVAFIGIWALFARFGQIQGWRFAEVALVYGVINMTFALSDMVTRGFEVFGPTFVKTGDFDRLLLRPRATTLQLFGYALHLQSLGRLSQGLLVLGVAVGSLDVHWGGVNVAILASSLAGGAALYCGLMIMQATLSFWTIENLEVMNVITFGSGEAAQYPLDIYSGWLRNFLTFVVPVGCVCYYPLRVVLGHWQPADSETIWLPSLGPAAGFAFLGLSLLAWRQGVRKYASSGS